MTGGEGCLDAKKAVRDSEVEREMQQLEREIDQAETAFNKVADRISSVTRPQPEVASNVKEETPMPDTVLAQRLAAYVNRLHGLTVRINNIQENIEL